ncbi:MAG: hypothetical protein AAGC46_09975 [Solirubrobacteraceae bacterium]
MPAFAATSPPSTTALVDAAPTAAASIGGEPAELDWDLDVPELFDDVVPVAAEISAPIVAAPSVEPVRPPVASVGPTGTQVRERIEPPPAQASSPGRGRRVAAFGVSGLVAAAVTAAVTGPLSSHGRHGAAPAAAPAASTVADDISQAVSVAGHRVNLVVRRADRQRRAAAEDRARARRAEVRAARAARARKRAAAAAKRVVVPSRAPSRIVTPAAPAPAAPTYSAPHTSSGSSARSDADREFGL